MYDYETKLINLLACNDNIFTPKEEQIIKFKNALNKAAEFYKTLDSSNRYNEVNNFENTRESIIDHKAKISWTKNNIGTNFEKEVNRLIFETKYNDQKFDIKRLQQRACNIYVDIITNDFYRDKYLAMRKDTEEAIDYDKLDVLKDENEVIIINCNYETKFEIMEIDEEFSKQKVYIKGGHCEEGKNIK